MNILEKARYLRELIAILESQRNTIVNCSYSLLAILNDAAKGFGNCEDIMDEFYILCRKPIGL